MASSADNCRTVIVFNATSGSLGGVMVRGARPEWTGIHHAGVQHQTCPKTYKCVTGFKSRPTGWGLCSWACSISRTGGGGHVAIESRRLRLVNVDFDIRAWLAINAAAMGRRGTTATGLCRCGDSGDGEIYAVKDNVYNVHLPRLYKSLKPRCFQLLLVLRWRK
jgi:hypothetical protein